MRQDNSKKLFAYWDVLRGNRPAPERSEIEPSDIRDLLGDTFILEVSARMRTIAFRLAGTRLCAAYGRELKGLGFLALWQEEDNFEIAKAVARVYRDYAPTVISYTAATDQSRFVEYEAILLPLLPAADGNARILGAAIPRKTPYWLGTEPLTTNHLRSIRQAELAIEAPPLAPLGDFSDTTVKEKENGRRRIAHLTVLDGGRD